MQYSGGGKTSWFLLVFFNEGNLSGVKVGGVGYYHVVCCLMHTLWSPHPALRFLSHTSQKYGTGQSLHPTQVTYFRWPLSPLGYLWDFPPGKIIRPATPFTVLPLQQQFCPYPQQRGRALEALPQHGPLMAGKLGTDIKNSSHFPLSSPPLPKSPPLIPAFSSLLIPLPKSPPLFPAFSSLLTPHQGHLTTACPEHIPDMAACRAEVQRQLWVPVCYHGRTSLPYLGTRCEVTLSSCRPSKRKE